ncbi:Gfo/Idh/MocA family oxidoreductase [Paracoccus sp. 1_MG-2023]|uniref:Gfo/Idh/MocA family protein n=1 Tax=unclassified Paracoccus (in: a-proteobacteria) TaxID=2688777 RepID=UPI001C07F9B0|nr:MULTISPECIES: Gfo/Idh/MocA family oxidoreductase [unclassified Paracoccus (in: a-proteobacteria)]MBU2957844.1 Gfo/Idh/MocA family oxidoreductase [Paracoccus sp. C2R09]MDO6667308.1 Gfo/Idh/MocA family oxidoreductase [Paracoccus sp. 1_MG-2023]
MKVLIAGTGFAAEGHAQAFRAAGAEIAGIVGRTPHVVDEIAQKLGIPHAGTDWPEALRICDPDIVSIATPGGAHYDPIKQAIAHGAHVFCDKPMTATADTAAELHRLAQKAGVKTAYAASFRYAPGVLHAKQLVAQGAIGEPTEVECISHFNLERGIPFGWSHRREDGGGRLNNNFTHTLSIVASVLGDRILSVMGEVRDDLERAPIVKGVHNFATRRDFMPKDLNDPTLEWGESNVEWSYTVMARIESALASKPVSVLFRHGGLVPRFHEDHIVFYGREGAIYVEGHYGSGQLHLFDKSGKWHALPLPEDIAARIPDTKGETEQCWHYLAREFTRDIRGEPHEDYPTFREGAQYQQIIELIRAEGNWTNLD